jgi:hypothetical protein
MARLVPQPGQYTSSHGMRAMMAHLIVGLHSVPRLVASAMFHWATARIAFIMGGLLGCLGTHVDRHPIGASGVVFGHGATERAALVRTQRRRWWFCNSPSSAARP